MTGWLYPTLTGKKNSWKAILFYPNTGNVNFNGTSLTKVIFNGTTVWEKQTSLYLVKNSALQGCQFLQGWQLAHGEDNDWYGGQSRVSGIQAQFINSWAFQSVIYLNKLIGSGFNTIHFDISFTWNEDGDDDCADWADEMVDTDAWMQFGITNNPTIPNEDDNGPTMLAASSFSIKTMRNQSQPQSRSFSCSVVGKSNYYPCIRFYGDSADEGGGDNWFFVNLVNVWVD